MTRSARYDADLRAIVSAGLRTALATVNLPSSIRVLVRGWLNCNQVVLRARGDNVLVDSGYCSHRERTLELVAGPQGLEGEPLERLVNTHCHSDHMGGNAALAHAYGCRITIPEGEAKHVSPWTPQSVWMEQFDQRADPFRFDDTLAAGDTFEGGGFAWEVHAAPGHDMDALMFFEPVNRILISGDALWENGLGMVWPEEGTQAGIAAALDTLDRIEALAPSGVIPGHGAPFAGVKEAVARARSRLEALGRDPAKNARHVIKVLFVFALLDKGRLPLADLEAYLARAARYRELGEKYLGLGVAQLARWLASELERGGAIEIRAGEIRPTAVA